MRMGMGFKRIVVGALSVVLALSGCGGAPRAGEAGSADSSAASATADTPTQSPTFDGFQTADIEFTDLSDPNLHRYLEDAVYNAVVEQLDSDEYYVENVQASYVSQEYLEELAYNSQANIYFGYTLAEVEEVFDGTRFVFTLDEETGETTVRSFEGYDDTYDRVVRNVAVGTGVILLCVTVSAVTGGMGLPAASWIFAVSAKAGAMGALSGGAVGGLIAGATTGIQTGDLEESLKAAALSGSEGFKWGAICGAISGGTSEAYQYGRTVRAFRGARLNGLTAEQAALVQRQTRYPLDVIAQFRNMDEVQVYRSAGLRAELVNGRTALVQDIDPNMQVTLRNGEVTTNLDLMRNGNAPFDATGHRYQLHHIAQRNDGTLAILTESDHQQYSSFLHDAGTPSEIDRTVFDSVTRPDFWKAYAAAFY